MNLRIAILVFLIILFISVGMGCTTTPYEDNLTQGYIGTRHGIHNQRMEPVVITGPNVRFEIVSNGFAHPPVRCGTKIYASWVDDKGKPGGKNLTLRCKGVTEIR